MNDAAAGDEKAARALVPSDEADPRGLEFGRAQGEALARTLVHMQTEIAHDGGQVQSGEYLVAYAIEEAEGMWVPKGRDLEWLEPEEENCHVEIAVCDPADGRLIPGLKVQAALLDGDGKSIESKTLPLLWHPYLYHYGANFKVPGDGTYGLRVRFDAPDFMRHDEKNGRRFLEGCEVTFDDVKVKAGQD